MTFRFSDYSLRSCSSITCTSVFLQERKSSQNDTLRTSAAVINRNEYESDIMDLLIYVSTVVKMKQGK